ncbi:MAG: hypothetical protein AMS14_11625 [Planctomycetes bacterium DG_20]|nr:MAG: hypothetical protein AMS14_11625 [Planctomycetes bacterium DG_20]
MTTGHHEGQEPPFVRLRAAPSEVEEPRWWRWLVAGVFAGALALQVHQVNTATVFRFAVPDVFDERLPINTAPGTKHPLLAVFLIRIPLALGSRSPFAVRLPFVVLSMAGLICAYLLARRGFGRWPALLALILLSVDQFHIIRSRTASEAVALAFVAPILYVFYRAVTENRPNLLAAAGLLVGIGYHGKEDTLLPAFALGLFLLAHRSRRRWFRRKELYGALFIVAALVLLDVYFNVSDTARNLTLLSQNVARVGLTLRATGLYLGELFLRTLNNPAEFVWRHNLWDWEVPTTNWVAGLLCLGAAVYATRRYRNEPTSLLLWVFWIVFAAASIFSPTHGLLEVKHKKWAGASLIPAAILAGSLLYQGVRRRRPAQLLVAALLGYFIGNGIRISLVQENVYSLPPQAVALERVMRQRRAMDLWQQCPPWMAPPAPRSTAPASAKALDASPGRGL